MQRNNLIQQALISWAKANANVLAELDDTNEIREDQWQGTEFSYPNYRLRLISQPVPLDDCDWSIVNFSFQARSEQASSLQADRMAGIMAEELRNNSFTSNGIRFFSVKITDLVPAVRENSRTWRSETLVRARISG